MVLNRVQVNMTAIRQARKHLVKDFRVKLKQEYLHIAFVFILSRMKNKEWGTKRFL